MLIILEFFLGFSVLLIGFIFFLYPLSIYFIHLFKKEKIYKNKIYPTVSIIIAAYNEEAILEKKIQNSLLASYPRKKIEVIIISDGSTDDTNRIIAKFKDNKRVKGIILENNKGKTTAINRGVKKAKGEIIVFTDANVFLDKHAVKNLVKNFSEKQVGCVCGQLNYFNSSESETASTGGLYWKYEEFIKKYESKTGSTMGADGSIFAIRSILFRNLEPYLIDDFSTSMGVLFQDYRIVFESTAKAFEKHTTKIDDELHRRRRIANRVFTAMNYFKKDLLGLDTFDKYKFFMHKFGRYWAGLLMIVAFIANSLLVFKSNFYLTIWVLQVIFYTLAACGFILDKLGKQLKLFYIPYYFFIMNWMQLLGVVDSLNGKRKVTWNTKNTSRK